MAWTDALTYRRVWDQERDAPRIREAFRAIAASPSHLWPQPADLVASLPLVPEQVALPPPRNPERAQAMIDQLAAELRMGRAG